MNCVQVASLEALRVGLGEIGATAANQVVMYDDLPPEGHESNWTQTVPGKGWFTLLRLYGPLEPWFDQTWRPGEFQLV